MEMNVLTRGERILLAIAAVGFTLVLAFVIWTGPQPWFEPRLQIDGGNYLRGMLSTTQTGLLGLQDLFHSPGYQLYLGLLYRLLGSDRAVILVVKGISFLMLLGCGAMVWALGRAWFSGATAATALVLLAFSPAIAVYVSLTQYEVPLAFLLTLHLLLLSQEKAKPRCFALAGLVGALACLIQVACLPLMLASAVVLYLRSERAGRALVCLAYLAPLVALVGGWSLYQSLRLDQFIVVTSASGQRFALGNNPGAQGYGFPHPLVSEPTGFRFLAQMPGRFLWLVGQRFLYLWDLKPDIWTIELPIGGSQLGFVLHLLSFVVFAFGFAVKLAEDHRAGALLRRAPIYLTFLGLFVPPLFVFGSSRFMVPVAPVVALFQGFALVTIFARDRSRK